MTTFGSFFKSILDINEIDTLCEYQLHSLSTEHRIFPTLILYLLDGYGKKTSLGTPHSHPVHSG